MKVTTETVTTVVVDDEKDFPELAKKHICMEKIQRPGEFLDVVVVDVNYDVGITIVLKRNKNVIVLCLNKKEIGNQYIENEAKYSNSFYRVVEAIKLGVITNDDAEFIQPGCTQVGTCPINNDRCGWGS